MVMRIVSLPMYNLPEMRTVNARFWDALRGLLVEAGLRKAELRAISRALGLATWDKPASPCLSSRFPYGTAITLDGLRQVAAAEQALHALGFREVRVRAHGEIARIELPVDELPRLADPALRAAAVGGVRAAGFRHVTVDLEGFRSGSLNALVSLEQRRLFSTP